MLTTCELLCGVVGQFDEPVDMPACNELLPISGKATNTAKDGWDGAVVVVPAEH